MKKPIRTVVTVLCNLLIFIALAEAAGLAVHFAREGSLFYFRQVEKDTGRMDRTGGAVASQYRMQPYWGFSARVNLRVPRKQKSTNNYGFVSEVNYPRPRNNDREVIIGIFGGSVAAQFTWYGSARLTEVLAGHPRFAGRDLVVLNFAGGGYKQPQQLQILSYFLSLGQPLDLVLSIDGFNEVALSPFNRRAGIEPAMPSATHFLPLVDLLNTSTLTAEKIAALGEIDRLKVQVDELRRTRRASRSAALHLVRDLRLRRLEARYSHATAAYHELAEAPAGTSLVAVAGNTDAVDDDEALFRLLATRWAESSLLMHQLLAARNTPYVHVLQPNQYYTERAFSKEEAALALNEDSPVRGNAAAGYPFLQESGTWLTGRGVSFYDATGVFDNEPQAVYADDCCHYSQLGYERLAEFIAERTFEP